MIYVLVDKTNEIVDKIDSITSGGAEHYFMERKKMYDKKKFYSLWKVLPKKEYDLNQYAFSRKASSEWWQSEEEYLDIDSSITKSRK